MMEYSLEISTAFIVYPRLGTMFSKVYNAQRCGNHAIWYSMLISHFRNELPNYLIEIFLFVIFPSLNSHSISKGNHKHRMKDLWDKLRHTLLTIQTSEHLVLISGTALRVFSVPFWKTNCNIFCKIIE